MAGNSRSGRKPKPTALKLLEGNRGKRRIVKEPEPDGQPLRPNWNDGEAIRFWDRNVPQLTELGIATKLDQDALEMMCQTYAAWLAAMQTDAVPDATKLFNSFWKIASCFGMTPADRTRLSFVKERTKENVAAKFLA